MLWRLPLVALCLSALLTVAPVSAHEGHDHDKPTPLSLPVAPRVVAVTPEFELVGVVSGEGRLTVFLHTFSTNEPIKGARMAISADGKSGEAEPRGDGVFSFSAPWLATTESIDLVFALTLSDGTQDLLTGQLKPVAALPPTSSAESGLAGIIARLNHRSDLVLIALLSSMAGVLATMLLTARSRRRVVEAAAISADARPPGLAEKVGDGDSRMARSRALVVAAITLGCAAVAAIPSASHAADPGPTSLPSVPASMATDLAQRMPDGTLFVPKATQHLLSVRTAIVAEGSAPRTVELTGTIIPGPEHFGRVQPGRPGRIEAGPGGLPFIGKRVEKGDVLAYVRTYIEAADRANLDGMIAETEGRIEKLKTIVTRYDSSPGAVPQVKVDEVRGELAALIRKRLELLPSVAARESIVAPISGVVSVATATIGQIVEARDILFEIVDPSQFWVEAIAFNADAGRDLLRAYAVASGIGQIPLEYAGRGLALRQQATVLTFRVVTASEGLAIGKPVKVMLQSTAKVEGFVLPASAIVRGQTGLPIVWIKTDPERFEPQIVKVVPLDGRSVVVTAGLKSDQRVVTDGVTLLNQVR